MTQLLFMPGRFRHGQQVRIIGKVHPDIHDGTTGTIDGKEIEGGFGVKIKDHRWLLAGCDRGQTITETRTIWIAKNQIKRI